MRCSLTQSLSRALKGASLVLISTCQVKSARQFLLASRASLSELCELPLADVAVAQPVAASRGLCRTSVRRRCLQCLASQADSSPAAKGAAFSKDARSPLTGAATLQRAFSFHIAAHNSVLHAAASLSRGFRAQANSGFSELAVSTRMECGNLPAHSARTIYFGSSLVSCQGNQAPS